MATVERDSTEAKEGVRIDLWAWSVRLFKSRTLAAAACKRGRLLVGGRRCRPSRLVRPGDRLELREGILVRQIEVKEILRQRVAAKELPHYLIDHTPAEDLARAAEVARAARSHGSAVRESGAGRPTKRDRRDIDDLKTSAEEDAPGFDDFVRAVLGRVPNR